MKEIPAGGSVPRPYWPHWCIHGRLYDLEPWLSTHPGGADFLHRTRGTDCTVAFELSHLAMARVRRHLPRFELREAEPQGFPQYEWSGYHRLRERVMMRLGERGWSPGPSVRGIVVATCALLLCVMTPLLWSLSNQTGFPVLAKAGLVVAYVEAFIIFGGFGHMYLHQNSRLSVFGDLMTMSSFEWKTAHCIEHHCYTNHPDYDNNVNKFEPLIHFAPGRSAQYQRLAPYLLLPVYALGFMIIRIMCPIGMLRDPRDLLRRVVLFLVGSCGWLVLWWWQDLLWVGLGLEAATSFVFCFITMSSHNTASCHAATTSTLSGGTDDFVQFQLDSAATIAAMHGRGKRGGGARWWRRGCGRRCH